VASLLTRTTIAYSVRNRRRKADRIVSIMRARDLCRVLLIGVTGSTSEWENIVENTVTDHGEFVVASGLGPEVAGSTHRIICNGLALPFRDGAFDLTVTNAVIEHVGDEAEQRLLVAEQLRVAPTAIITTPNRWFPVESHTRVLFRHWSTAWRARHRKRFTRLLSRNEFRELLPETASLEGQPWSPTFFAIADRAGGRGN
jgi:hypothetical protein